MKQLPLAMSLVLLAAPAWAADYAMSPASTLGFTSSFQGESFDGSFKKFTAAIS